MKPLIVMLLMLASLVFCNQELVAECTDLDIPDSGVSSESAVLRTNKVQYASTIISEQQYRTQTEACVAKALFYLGKSKVHESIPRMIELLKFEHHVANPVRVRTRNEQYPAIAGLAAMGKPAVPALVRVIANPESDVITVDNSTYALMTIYQDEPRAGIEILRKAAGAQQDQGAAANFRKALSKAESIWCKDASKCEGLRN